MAGALIFEIFGWRPCRTSWLIVGTETLLLSLSATALVDSVHDPTSARHPGRVGTRLESDRRETAPLRWPPASDGPPQRALSLLGGDLSGAARFDGWPGPPRADRGR